MVSPGKNPRSQSPTTAPAVRRRLRHVLSFGVHGLTATPHKDEVLQAAAAGSHGWQHDGWASDDGAAAEGTPNGRSAERLTTRQRSLDDLDLVGIKGRRRGASAGSARSLQIPPSSPSNYGSPSLPSSSSFGALPSTSPSSPNLPRRPSLSRARNSSRLSLHGHPSRSYQGSSYGPPDDLAASPNPSPTIARFRSRSITRSSVVVDHSQRPAELAFTHEGDAIPECPEDVQSPAGRAVSWSEGFFALDEERDRALRHAGERLLESFITLRLSEARAEDLLAAQPSSSEARLLGQPSSLEVSPMRGDDRRKRSKEEERKGKFRAESPAALHSAESSSSSLGSATQSPSCSTSRRSSVSTTPSSPPTPRPTSTSASHPSTSVTEGAQPSNPHATPFFVSPPHKPSTHPRFAELASDGSDYAPWARDGGVTREETVVVELWSRKRVRGALGIAAGEMGWARLKQWEVHLNDLRRWDGRTLLPPNTLTIRFVGSADTYVLPPPAMTGRPRLERVLSDPELNSQQRVVEWGGVDEAITRSLRETRMKAGVSAENLKRLLQAQSDLQIVQLSLREFRSEVDDLLRQFDEVDQLRRHTHQVEAGTRAIKEQQQSMRSRADATRSNIVKLREDIKRRKQQLDTGQIVLQEEQTRQRDLEASIQLENSLRSDIRPYLLGAEGTLIRRLDSLFPIVPVANGRAQPIFTIVSVALPLPSLPKEPAPPMSVPSTQLPPGIVVDEDNVAAALGYVALLVDRLAGYVGAKLPYPLTCAGSRSLVKDPISDIAGPTRLFPLYSKGIEQYRFEYAVFLLNKDIELLMVGRGLRIMDIRHTLPNLMNLLLTISSDLPMPATSRDLPRPAHLRSATSDAAQDQGQLHVSTSLGRFEDETESESEAVGTSDEDNDNAGDRTPKAHEPASRGLFWGLSGGSSSTASAGAGTKTVSEKTAKSVPSQRSRRGTLIARAFVGQGSASKEREQSGSGSAGGSPKGPVATL